MSRRTKLACCMVMVALALAVFVPSLALAGKPQPPPPPLTNPALAFVIGYPGQVYVMTADGKTVRQLSNLPGGSHPLPSPPA